MNNPKKPAAKKPAAKKPVAKKAAKGKMPPELLERFKKKSEGAKGKPAASKGSKKLPPALAKKAADMKAKAKKK